VALGLEEFTGVAVGDALFTLLLTELLLLFATSVAGVLVLALTLTEPGVTLLLEPFLRLECLMSLPAIEELSLPPSLVPSPSAGIIMVVVLVTISSVSSYVE